MNATHRDRSCLVVITGGQASCAINSRRLILAAYPCLQTFLADICVPMVALELGSELDAYVMLEYLRWGRMNRNQC